MWKRPGRTRCKLAEMLSEALGEFVDPSDIWSQSGAYRTQVRHDALVWGVGDRIGSWDTMTECVKRGFTVTREGGLRQPTASGCPIQIDVK
jgi:hypothetical protein